jgi:prevent-host-death family protein
MIHITATDAKTRFGEVLDKARQEAIIIMKMGRAVVAMISQEQFEAFQAMEDELWALKATAAKKKGFLSEKESNALLQDMLDA